MCLCSGGWSSISRVSLEGNAFSSSELSFGVSVGLVWIWGACPLIFMVVFLFCCRISVRCLVLELSGSWVELCLRVGMEALVWALIY